MVVHVFLSKVFTIRMDLPKLKSDDYQLILIATKEVLARLPAEKQACFHKIYVTDFTDEDLRKNLQTIMQELDLKSDRINLVTNDEFALLPAARLREEFGIPGAKADSVEPFLNKHLMKQKVASGGVRTPHYVVFNPEEYAQNKTKYVSDVIHTLKGTHIFAKPIDGSASIGVAELKSAEDLSLWCEQHPDAHNYELDEFLEGTLYHVDSLVRDEKICEVQVSIYSYPNAEFLKGKPIGSRVLTPDEEEHSALVEFNQAVLKAMTPVPNGATHLEVFRKSDGEFVFVEIAARPAGALVPDVYEKYLGINFEEAHFCLQMGSPLPTPLPAEERTVVAGWLWYPSRDGEVTSLRTKMPLNSDYQLQHRVRPGDLLKKADSLLGIVAVLFIYSTNKREFIEDFERAQQSQYAPVTVYPRRVLQNQEVNEEKPEDQGDIKSDRTQKDWKSTNL